MAAGGPGKSQASMEEMEEEAKAVKQGFPAMNRNADRSDSPPSGGQPPTWEKKGVTTEVLQWTIEMAKIPEPSRTWEKAQ
jgi:hypothetical protein